MKVKLEEDFLKFIKFLIVGFANTAISLLAFYLLYNFLHLYYLLASLAGYLAGLGNSYFWNLRWTFRERHSQKILIRFVIVNLVALISKLLLMRFFVDQLLWPALPAEILAMGISLIINFAGNRFWTFQGEKSKGV